MVKMSISYFNNIEKLGDSSNFVAWKIVVEAILDDNDVLEYVEGKVPEPPENAPTAIKAKYNKGDIKAKKILTDSLKDHFPTYIVKLE